MALLKLLFVPHPKLSQVAEPVTEVNDAIRQQLDDLEETMYVEDGVGLAAVQVGIMKRMIIVDQLWFTDQEGRKPLHMVNPEIIEASSKMETHAQGCVSVPGVQLDVARPSKITVKYLDYNGKEQTLKAEGLYATCIHHEIDHLNGVTLLDYMSPLKKKMALKKVRKYEKALERA